MRETATSPSRGGPVERRGIRKSSRLTGFLAGEERESPPLATATTSDHQSSGVPHPGTSMTDRRPRSSGFSLSVPATTICWPCRFSLLPLRHRFRSSRPMIGLNDSRNAARVRVWRTWGLGRRGSSRRRVRHDARLFWYRFFFRSCAVVLCPRPTFEFRVLVSYVNRCRYAVGAPALVCLGAAADTPEAKALTYIYRRSDRHI